MSNDEENEDKFYRYMEIIVQDVNETDQWVIQGEGKYLEDGVYLLPQDDSKVGTPDNWSDLARSLQLSGVPTFESSWGNR